MAMVESKTMNPPTNTFTKTIEATNIYTSSKEHLKLNPTQQLKLALLNKTPIGQRTYNGWKGQLPFYLYRCKKCGNHHIDYNHGFKNQQYLLCEKQTNHLQITTTHRIP